MFYRINLQYLPSVRLADSVVIEPPYVHRRRKADEYIVYLIKKGVMYLEENGETVTLQPGDMYVLDPRYIHVGVKASWCEYFYVHFRHPDMEPLEEETEKGLQKLLLENRQASVQSDIFSYEKCEGQNLYLPKSYHIHDYSSLVKVTELLNEAMERNITQLEGAGGLRGNKQKLRDGGNGGLCGEAAPFLPECAGAFELPEQGICGRYYRTVPGKRVRRQFRLYEQDV